MSRLSAAQGPFHIVSLVSFGRVYPVGYWQPHYHLVHIENVNLQHLGVVFVGGNKPAGSTPGATPSWRAVARIYLSSDGDEDKDENIALEKDVVSLICPLKQQVMPESSSNRWCKHTFEKESIQCLEIDDAKNVISNTSGS
ncbi:chromosomal organization and DNA repair protein Mms21 [Emericellopsis cladophorae]|uniref:Chromosomal organization and DNA repair protein Mms21 n=1 Tax=Emericellopsis cladophorae TaxID=2686198 RepID=A0A9Q0BB05_9HYPO|nr:chromosomal organization and DNA repair protein Mms21 [Emericellopsis cladophorae]KAI6777995.1 chromosomal organization and DNA repair protein Mms21 [Emericellopsis cladophorae]